MGVPGLAEPAEVLAGCGHPARPVPTVPGRGVGPGGLLGVHQHPDHRALGTSAAGCRVGIPEKERVPRPRALRSNNRPHTDFRPIYSRGPTGYISQVRGASFRRLVRAKIL